MKILATLILVLFTNISYASELNIVVASAETDGQTTNARIFGRYLSKYILPDTKLIIRVVPGAAGVNQANHVYNIAPKDGNTISTLLKNIPIVGTIGGPSIQYDARRFFWLGSVADGRKDAVVLVSNKTYDGTELVIGADNVVTADPINFIKNYTNINIRRVSGYPNANSVRLSYQRREIDGFVSNLQGIKLNNSEWIRTENFLVQLGNGFSRHPELPNTPTMSELITNEEGRKLISIFETQFALLRPFVAPPGIPEDKKKILLRAFEMAVKDPEYIKDATKISLNIDPIYSDEAQRIVDSTYSISKELLDKIK